MKMEKQRAQHNSTILEEAGSVIPLAESHPVSSILQVKTLQVKTISHLIRDQRKIIMSILV